jgi:hypothetical protein
MDRTEDLGRLGRWDLSKRSPDERSDIRGLLSFPAFRCAHAGYLLKAVTIPIQRNTLQIECEPSHT